MRCIFITDDCEDIIPKYLNFIWGIVDSDYVRCIFLMDGHEDFIPKYLNFV